VWKERSFKGQGLGVFRYAARRTTRNKKLFLAILVGVVIASTLFATANIGANSLIGAMLNEALASTPIDMTYHFDLWGSIPSNHTFFGARQEIESFTEVLDTELIIRHQIGSMFEPETQYYLTTGIQQNSTLYNGIQLMAGNLTLQANETLIVTSSSLIADYPLGSNYSIQVGIPTETDWVDYNLTLDVTGHVEVTNDVISTLMSGVWFPFWGYEYESWIQSHVTFFIVDVESTFFPIFDFAQTVPNVEYVDIDARINIYIDRASLINPYNIQTSVQTLNQLNYRITNQLWIQYQGYLSNDLAYSLQMFYSLSETFRLAFLQISIPVFFVALYMGITLNDVSYSIRRREIGLLLTKGVTRSTITSLFVWEALMIGIFAGILGIGSAILLIPYFIPTVTWQTIFITGLGIDTIFLTFVFSIFIAVITSYLPARKAAKIPTAEAIREYTLAGEPTGYNRFAAWSLLILGSYKLVVWLLGVNVGELAIQLIFSNPLLGSLSIYWVLFDAFMSFWGPLFFLWGLTTLVVKGWKGFYRASQNFISRILGDLGGLASHNIQRRPGRTVAIIFMTALLVGYGVQTIGVLSSSQDVAIREAYRTVGADLDVLVSTPTNVSDLLPILREIEGVKGAAGQFTFSINTVSTGISVRAINVSEWTGVGYFEPNWFSDVPASVALNAIATDNESIILERKIAVELDVNLEESISVQIGALPFIQLNIDGFFGPEPLITQGFFGGISIEAETTWSYMSTEFMWDHFLELSPIGHILVALDSPSFNNDVKQAIEALDDVLQVESAATLIEQYNTDVLRNSTTNMMQMGVFFAFGLAGIGTLVIIYLTLRERRTTTALMSARGMTYTQTVIILMAETLTMMVFAIFIGLLVGLTIYYGLITGGTSGIPQLVEPLFLPPAFLGMFSLQNAILVGLLLLTTVIPILVEARVARYDLSVLR